MRDILVEPALGNLSGLRRERQQLQEKYEVYKSENATVGPLPPWSAASLRAYSFVKKHHIIDSPELILRTSDMIESGEQPQFPTWTKGPRLQTAQSRFAYATGQRRRARDMGQWLSNQVERLGSSEELRLSDVIQYKQQLFAGYLDALVDSLDKQCHEKAQCLRLVWKLLSRLVQKVIQALLSKLHSNQHSNYQQQHTLHLTYQSKLHQLSTANSTLQTQNSQQREFISNLIYNLRFKRRELRKLYIAVRHATDKINEFKEEYIDLVNEHIELQMYVKDIGRETAEMLVERKRMINQERHKKLRLTQSRRVNRRQIVEHLGKEDGKEVQALAVNLEANYHVLKGQKGRRFLMDNQLEEFGATLPEDVLGSAPFVVQDNSYGFMDEAVSAMHIQCEHQNRCVQTSYYDRLRLNHIQNKQTQIDTQQRPKKHLHCAWTQTKRNLDTFVTTHEIIIPEKSLNTSQPSCRQVKKYPVKKKMDRSKELDEKTDRGRNVVTPVPKPKPKTADNVKRKPQKLGDNTIAITRKAVRQLRRFSNLPKSEDLKLDEFLTLQEEPHKIEVKSINVRANTAAAKPRNQSPSIKRQPPAPVEPKNKGPKRKGILINIGNSEGTWTQQAIMISKFKQFAKEIAHDDENISSFNGDESNYGDGISEMPPGQASASLESIPQAPEVENMLTVERIPKKPSKFGSAISRQPLFIQAAQKASFRKSGPISANHHSSQRGNQLPLPLLLPYPQTQPAPTIMAVSSIPIAPPGIRQDKVEMAVERCLQIARESTIRDPGLQIPKLNTKMVQVLIQRAMSSTSKPSGQKNLSQSLMRTISQIFSLADTKLCAKQKISSLLDLAFDSLMYGYGNLKSSNIQGRLQQLLSNVYLSKQKHIVFELFSLLAGMHDTLGAVASVDEFILALRLLKGLNCCAVPGQTVESAFTSPEKIQAGCSGLMRGHVGKSYCEGVAMSVMQLLAGLKATDRVCLVKTIHFVVTQLLELKLKYQNDYRKFLNFLGETRITIDIFEFFLRCMQIRKATLVEIAQRFAERCQQQCTKTQPKPDNCPTATITPPCKSMTLQSFSGFAIQHDFPTFSQICQTASLTLQPRWQSLFNTDSFFEQGNLELWRTESDYLESELRACCRFTQIEKKLLKRMTETFESGETAEARMVASLYELLVYAVMDAQAHKMLIGMIAGDYQEIYSLSIKICLM